MKGTIGVASEVLPLHAKGVLFVGPFSRTAWCLEGDLSWGLATVTGWSVAAHPWDPWPNQPPAPAAATPGRTASTRARAGGRR